ncbi:hypothetical protein J3E06_000308 [Methanococcus voltae]|nr:MFS transporter [Methanococcus voltae]MCS3900636.1 hypothetical protein [Methanococcus voltae]
MKEFKELKNNPMYYYIIPLSILATVGLQIWNTLFNNFGVDIVGINGLQVGMIQSIREIPGFLTFLVVYVLLIIKEHRLAALSVVLSGLGVALTGYFPSVEGLMFTTFLMSLGFHFFETTNQSLTLQHFTKKQAPLMFGRIKSLSALGNIIIGIIIWFTASYWSLKYNYLVLGSIISLGGIYLLLNCPKVPETTVQKKKMVIKRKYWLYYVLNFLSGARRQIFMVFVLFLLVEKYQFSVLQITTLFIINNIISFIIYPKIAKYINIYGERKMLSVEYSMLIFVFLIYAFVENPLIAALMYITDNIFYNFAIGINTYFQKTAEPSDIAPSVATGFTINHILAVGMPLIGGALWLINWKIPFVIGAVLSVVSLIFVQKIKYPNNMYD